MSFKLTSALREDDPYPLLKQMVGLYSEKTEEDVEFFTSLFFPFTDEEEATEDEEFSALALLVDLIKVRKGRISATSSTVVFRSNETQYSWEISIGDIIRFVPKHFKQHNVAVEIYFVGSTSEFISFSSEEERNEFCALLKKYGVTCAGYSLQDYQDLWDKNLINNYQYIIALNDLASRSFKVLSQYPIFPWIISNYDSSSLDLMDAKNFRPLDTPILSLSKKAALKPQIHYAQPLTVARYLMYLYPELQRLIPADTKIESILGLWKEVLSGNSNIGELIPEYFDSGTCPISYVETNTHEILRKHITCPPWSSDNPRLFNLQQSAALESTHVSSTLHHWIDLVFGFKQQGQEADNSGNALHASSSRLETKPLDLDHVVMTVYDYGETPVQLFKTAHPKRKPSFQGGMKHALELEKTALQQNLTEQIQALKAQNNQLTAQLEQQNKEHEATKRLLEAKEQLTKQLQEKNDSSVKNVQKMQTQIEVLRKQLQTGEAGSGSSSENYQVQVTDLQVEMAEKDAKIASLEANAATHEKLANAFKEDIADLRKSHSQLEKTNQQLNQIAKHYETVLTELTLNKRIIDEQSNELAKRNDKIAELKKALQQAGTQRSNGSSELDEKTKLLELERSRGEEYKKRAEQAEKQLSATLETVNEKTKSVQELTHLLNIYKTRERTQIHMSRARSRQSRDMSWQSILDEVESKYHELSAKYNVVNEDRNDMKRKYRTLMIDSEKKEAALQTAIKRLEEKVTQSVAEKNEALTRKKEVEIVNSDLQKQARQLSIIVRFLEQKVETQLFVQAKSFAGINMPFSDIPSSFVYSSNSDVKNPREESALSPRERKTPRTPRETTEPILTPRGFTSTTRPKSARDNAEAPLSARSKPNTPRETTSKVQTPRESSNGGFASATKRIPKTPMPKSAASDARPKSAPNSKAATNASSARIPKLNLSALKM